MNNENNINGIPNVNDVKIEETPAESFASLYGNGAQPNQQPMQNPQMVQPTSPAQAPQVPNPQPVQSVQPQVAPAPQVVQPVQAQPVQPQPMPNPQVAQPVSPVQPQVAQTQNQQVVQPVAPVQPIGPQPVPTPQVVEPIQPVQVDADRLQSIEEQLSKTSQYKPEDFQQEKIDIPTTNQYEKNKSGLTFVIVLFIILVLAIVAIPYITKFFS